MNTVMTFGFHKNREFLDWVTIRFSRRALLHGVRIFCKSL